MLHGALGCALGAVSGGGKGCAAGATGAVVGELMAEIYAHSAIQDAMAEIGSGGKLSEKTFAAIRRDAALMGKLTAMGAALFTGQDVNIAATTAGNAIDNNFLFTAMAIIGIGLTIWDAYENYRKGGAMAALEGLAMDGLISLTPLAAGKIAMKLGGKELVFKSAEAAWSYLKKTKLFQRAGQCFVAGTPVRTVDGYKPIEAVRAGDIVLSRDPETGEMRPARVKRTFVRRAHRVVWVTLASADGARMETLGTTEEHPFHVPGRGFVKAIALKPGMMVSSAAGGMGRARVYQTGGPHGDDASGFLLVKALTIDDRPTRVYNFEVEGTHTYFVGHLNAWVHNACLPPKSGFNKPHKNSLDYVGETHVYSIRGPNGTYKIGESAQGTRVRDGASIRAEQQARRLRRETGEQYITKIRKVFPNKRAAREYETRLIERFRRRYGEDALPGNKTNR